MDSKTQKYLTKDDYEKQTKLDEELKKDSEKKLWQHKNFLELQKKPKGSPKQIVQPQIPQNLT